MKKLSGFTTMELSIVLLMTSLIGSIAYNGYLLFKRQVRLHQLNEEKDINIQSFHRLVKKDLFVSKQIFADRNQLVVDTGKDSIVYRYEETYLVREFNGLKDTLFDVEEFKLIPYKETNPNGLISEINYVLKYKKEAYMIRFKKEYGVKQLIEEEVRNGN